MRNLSLIALLLAACQTTSIPTAAELDQQLRSRAVAFATAMENRDTAAGLTYAASSAKGFFAAEMEFTKYQWGEHEPREPAAVTVQSTNREGDIGIAVISMDRDGEGQDLALHFELENYVWGVVGFSREEGDAPRLFADQEAQVRERIAAAIKETTPHAEFGPMVTAYLAAAANKDRAAMTANMSADCKKKQSGKNSFTGGFLAGEFQVKKWQFASHEVEGNTGNQRVRTILVMPDGETDNEPMTFEFEKAASGWVITRLR